MAATVSKTLRAQSRSLKITRRITGAVFVALGIRLATQPMR
jgi:threonine/homoserine/homoserine lactone efflux protein